MALKCFLLLLTVLFLQAHTVKTQSCYIRLMDASGIDTDAYHQDLEAAACSLRAVFPLGFQQSFKVFDFGFYLHNPVAAGYPQIFEKARNIAASSSPYYLLFGKQSDHTGIYTKFWVDLKLPNTGKFACIDLLAPTLREDIRKKVEYTAEMTYEQDERLYSHYARSEKAAMLVLQEIIIKLVDCCALEAQNARPANACNAFVFPADLKEVTYSGEHYVEMKQDIGDKQPFPKPHFMLIRPNDSQSPIACVGGLNINAYAVFSGNEIFQTIKIRAKGKTKVDKSTVEITFGEQVASQNPITKQITANMLGKTPYMSAFLDDFKIKWEMKVKKSGEPEGDWEPVGECVNDWYLTLKQPIAEEPEKGYLHFHTLFDISCKYGKGASNSELITGVWAHFKGLKVKRGDGQPLKYYGQWSGSYLASKTSLLLQNRDGNCTAWARFLLDVLKVHGYKEPDNYITVKSYASMGFLIKKWEHINNSTSYPNTPYPYRNTGKEPLYTSNNTYDWSYAEVKLTKASQAQNNDNPVSDFSHHAFAKINGIFYDPSYGLSYGKPATVMLPSFTANGINEIKTQVVELDEKVISAYYIKFGNEYKIQLNNPTLSDKIIVVEMDDGTNHY